MALLVTVFGLALRFGGAPERWTGVMFVAAASATYGLYRVPTLRFYTIEWAVALVDLVLLAGLTVILLRADRFWPIAMFAVQGVAVLAHVIKSFDASIVRHAYAIAIVVPSYATLLILTAGVIRHRGRLGRAGRDLDWSAHAGGRT